MTQNNGWLDIPLAEEIHQSDLKHGTAGLADSRVIYAEVVLSGEHGGWQSSTGVYIACEIIYLPSKSHLDPSVLKKDEASSSDVWNVG
jgi:hypothetical protein